MVVCVFLCFGRRAAALGSAAAVVVGFGWANFTFEAVSGDNTGRVIPWVAEPDAPAWHALPWAGVVLLAAGLVSRGIGFLVARLLDERRRWIASLLVWVVRAGVVAVVAPGLVPLAWAAEVAWLKPALAAAMLALWLVLDRAARDKASSEVTAYLAAAFLAAGAVLLYHHTARFMDLAVMCGCAAAGVAVASFPTRADASAAVPLGVVGLPGLMLNGRYLVESQVPVTSFCLVALAPLGLIPFLIPVVARLPRWVVILLRAVFVLAPLVAAVVLAAQHEKLAFEEEW
ncbi:hypothetical protein ETAA1_34640 [Urbifossiella limnaea]|uniref:Uncharacterized protein n=2 Tax=Urbifossiella limnaea TaxID=2528023 RepID=A0A517XVI0_9BACT|nr:hypothetical protein ETAA1_34640 [Urbifossiella limnaea]